jgi:hypothetical protein
MSLPLSFSRVYAALKRLMPPASFLGRSYSQDDASDVMKELASTAVAAGTVADAFELVLDELFPTTTTRLIDRWETGTGNASRPSDMIEKRRGRVLATLRRANGPQLAKLASALSELLACTAAELVFIEQTRANIEAALTHDSGVIASALPNAAPAAPQFCVTKYWPDVVDDLGVRVFIAVDVFHGVQATLTHPDGTTWNFAPPTASGWCETRTIFKGKPAGGTWKLSVYDAAGGVTLTEWKLLVSNATDSAQIYRFYVVRDADLAGVPDLLEAQRHFNRYAHGHNKKTVAERMTVVVDDAHSLCDRDPVGV